MSSTTESATTDPQTITQHDQEQIERANATATTPIVEVAETALACVKRFAER